MSTTGAGGMVGGARDVILARIAAAEVAAAPTVPRAYRGVSAPPSAGTADVGPSDIVERLVDRLVDYKAVVHRGAIAQAREVVARALAAGGAVRVVVPAGFPDAWVPDAVEVVVDDPPLSHAALDALDGVLTTCHVAVAETGTIVLDGGAGQGRRALSLVPDRHVVVVRADQVVAGVPDAVAALTATRPQTWISGPSATSDIELQRVEGVHGPRRLHVVLLE